MHLGPALVARKSLGGVGGGTLYETQIRNAARESAAGKFRAAADYVVVPAGSCGAYEWLNPAPVIRP